MPSDSRDWYLSTLGVVQYRLRGDSDGRVSGQSENFEGVMARANPSEVTPGPLGPGSGGRANTVPPGSPAIDHARAARALDDASAPVPTAISNPEEGKQARTENSVAFRLACWRAGEDLMVIDSWPRGLGAENQRLQLLGNVLKSIQRKPQQLLAPEFIDWPIGGDTSLSAACAYLSVFIKGRYQQAPFRWLLAMGEDAVACLGRANGALPTPSPPTAIEGVDLICTHSLTEMIEAPSRKREVWRAIRCLAR